MTPTEWTVGLTILKQLGGRMFQVMTGAKPVLIKNGVMIHLPRMSKLSCVQITLDPSDTYNIQGYRGYGTKIRPEGEILEGVYCDQLKEILERLTGLYVSL